MYRVWKRTGETFDMGQESIGEFETFEQAKEFAVKNVCAMVSLEGHSESFWFSDNTEDSAYKVHIEKI